MQSVICRRPNGSRKLNGTTRMNALLDKNFPLYFLLLCAAVVRRDRAVGFHVRLVFPYAKIPRSTRNPSSHIQQSIRFHRSRGRPLALDLKRLPRRTARRHDANLCAALKRFFCSLERNECHQKGPPLVEGRHNFLWQSAGRQPYPHNRPRQSSCACRRKILAGAGPIP